LVKAKQSMRTTTTICSLQVQSWIYKKKLNSKANELQTHLFLETHLSWPWKKKSNNKATTTIVITTLTSTRGVGGASPNLASLFQNNKHVQTSPPHLFFSLCVCLCCSLLFQTSLAMVVRWEIIISQLCKPRTKITTIFI